MSEGKDGIKRNPELSGLVKKARRRSIIRTIIIALIISVIVIVGLFAGGKYLLNKSLEEEFTVKSLWNSIHGANVRMDGTLYSYSAFSATATTSYVKDVDGIPVPWGTEEVTFPLVGSPVTDTNLNASGFAPAGSERMDTYVNGNRVIEFFHPDVTYPSLFDDRSSLEKMDDVTVAELALSFDRAYTEEEVREVFGDALSWLWVDTFSDERIEEHDMLNEQHSFAYLTDGGSAFGYTASAANVSFVSSINELIALGEGYQESAKDLSKVMTNGEDRELTAEDVGIIGVVLTGYADELSEFSDEPMIRAATLGVTADKYIED